MRCKNEFCIYCKEDNCILNSISIDTLGTCADCIHVTIEAEQLERAKEDLLRKFHEDED